MSLTLVKATDIANTESFTFQSANVTGNLIVSGINVQNYLQSSFDTANSAYNRANSSLVVTSATSGNIIPNSSNTSQLNAIQLTGNVTFDPPIGSPVDGQRMVFRIKDDSNSIRNLTWTTTGTNCYRVIGITLPTQTVLNKTMYVGFVYNTQSSTWDAIAYTIEV